MAEETTTEVPEPASNPALPEGTAAPDEALTAPEPLPSTEQEPVAESTSAESPATSEPAPETSSAEAEANTAQAEAAPAEPDEIQPFIDKAYETITHEVASEDLGKFLRAHIKTFREEWDIWSDSAKDAYVHMMTSQLLQRKAAATQIKIGNVFKLPVPSAQTQLFESIQQAMRKPPKRQIVLLMPPNLRPTYSLKK